MRDFHYPGRSPVFATGGMCATSHPLAAQVAVDLMRRGGNAVDAAIGAAVLLGQCEPPMTGLFGDCFVLLKPAGTERVIGLNGSGRAPSGIDAGAIRAAGHADVPLQGPEAITLPGAVDAFCRLSADHGRLPLAEVLAPAIDYAGTGVPVAPRVAWDWSRKAHLLTGAARRHYLRDGAPYVTGEMFRMPGQAEVLRRVAAEGRAGFYEGEVAEDLIGSLRAMGGCHTLDDLAATRCDYTEPVSGTYGGIELVEHPPNGQGVAALLLLNILSHFDLGGLDPLGAERAHIEVEASKLAYDARNRFVADPDHAARIEHMLAPETARQLAGLIRRDRVLPPAALGTEQVHRDTVYLCVVDGDGMAVSMIFSIFKSFGSGHASERLGLLFHNRGAGFTLAEGHPNEIGPGKRPMHTIIPGMLREGGKVIMPFGVMGGQYQAAGHARFVTNLRDFGMDPQSAIDAPRLFQEGPDCEVEPSYGAAVRQALADLGHNVVDPPAPIGGAQAIRIHGDGVLEGASDPRKDGQAAGF